MTEQIVDLEENMIVITQIDGAPTEVIVPKHGLQAAMALGIEILDSKSEIIKNRFGGDSIELDPIAISVYDLCLGSERFGQWSTMRKCLDWFIDYRPKAYYVLLD